jgi:hypothetical protein
LTEIGRRARPERTGEQGVLGFPLLIRHELESFGERDPRRRSLFGVVGGQIGGERVDDGEEDDRPDRVALSRCGGGDIQQRRSIAVVEIGKGFPDGLQDVELHVRIRVEAQDIDDFSPSGRSNGILLGVQQREDRRHEGRNSRQHDREKMSAAVLAGVLHAVPLYLDGPSMRRSVQVRILAPEVAGAYNGRP